MPKVISILTHTHLKITNEGEIAGKKTARIVIDGPIGGHMWWEEPQDDAILTKEKLRAELDAITAIKADVIIVEIDSLGGDVGHAVSMHDMLKKHPAHIITDAVGLVASAATIIQQAGDERRQSANTLGLIHKASTFAWGNTDALETAAQELKKFDTRIENIYAKRSGKKMNVFADQMQQNGGQGVWMSPDEMKDMGLIDDVYEPMKAVASAYRKPDAVVLAQWGLPTFDAKAVANDGLVVLNQTANMKTKKPVKNVVLNTIKLNELLKKSPENLTEEDKTFIKEQKAALAAINTALDEKLEGEEAGEESEEGSDDDATEEGSEEEGEEEGEESDDDAAEEDDAEATKTTTNKKKKVVNKGADPMKEMRKELDALKAKNSALESKVNKRAAGPINIVAGGDPTINGEQKPLTKNQRNAAKNAAALLGKDDSDDDEASTPEKETKPKK